MKQNRKYFGMNTQQISILAGLAVVAFLLFAVAGWLFLRGGSFASAPQNTPTPQPTVTPFVLPTSTLTETPTPVPYDLLIPEGWVQFRTELVELWLPNNFKLEKSKILENSANLAVPELVITEVSSKSSLYNMAVVVSYEPLTVDSLDAYLTNKIANLPPETRVAEKRMVNINSQDVVRFVFEVRKDNIEVNDLAYVFLDGSTVWYVEYAAQINEFYEMLSMFEQSAKTFRIAR